MRPTTEGPRLVAAPEYLQCADRALAGMRDLVAALGDERANERPAVPGANTPYALLTHCLGVVDYWCGHLVAGRPVERDRDAEFRARGPVGPLLARADAVRAQLAADVVAADPGAPLTAEPPAEYLGPDGIGTRGAALLHVLEELVQHHGQMEVLRDALVAEARA
ncbi:DinB family protein [Modestobacter sp. NPDC049651]|uniref:DinB family protein n=1 Tax=unclassified Modestobacter TaxID=2643866 RepID=UPI0033C467A1